MGGSTDPEDSPSGHDFGPEWQAVGRHDWDGTTELDVTLLEVLCRAGSDVPHARNDGAVVESGGGSRAPVDHDEGRSVPLSLDDADFGPPLYPAVDAEMVTAVLDSVPEGVPRAAVVELTVRGRSVAITSDGVVAVRTRERFG